MYNIFEQYDVDNDLIKPSERVTSAVSDLRRLVSSRDRGDLITGKQRTTGSHYKVDNSLHEKDITLSSALIDDRVGLPNTRKRGHSKPNNYKRYQSAFELQPKLASIAEDDEDSAKEGNRKDSVAVRRSKTSWAGGEGEARKYNKEISAADDALREARRRPLIDGTRKNKDLNFILSTQQLTVPNDVGTLMTLLESPLPTCINPVWIIHNHS